MTESMADLVRFLRRVDIPSRWGLLGLGLWTLWRTKEAGWGGMWLAIFGAYVLLAVLATAVSAVAPGLKAGQGFRLHLMAYVTYFADALFACTLIWRDGGLGSPLYVLLGLLALKAVGLATTLPAMVWAPFGFGPLYALALWLETGNFAFLADWTFIGRYLLLWAWLCGLVLLAWELERRTARASALESAMNQQQGALAQKTDVLQRTAADLGDRVLELRSLQEISRALASTLRLEETLQVIVERLRGVTGSTHCAVALLDSDPGAEPSDWPQSDEGYLDGVMALEEEADENPHTFRVPLPEEPATIEALREDRVLRVRGGDSPLRQRLGAGDYLIAPLVSRGRSIGALYLMESNGVAADSVSSSGATGRDKIEQLVSSFSYFAATAIENARLYQDAWEKRRELEAVLAGIGDGVLVVDPGLHLILMNPVARDILGLEEEPPAGVPLRPYLAAPAVADLLSDTLTSQKEQIRELDLLTRPSSKGETASDGSTHSMRAAARQVGSAVAHTYGALASPVLDADGGVTGVVAVLRDITAQKELERMKSNFLSVVSHELRTPLHSIKGFVEIILMGKTGPVTELQQDFLQTVKGQTTVLQRMIDDLLELSRMEAGRVKLQMGPVSLPAIAEAVASKLAPLAAEARLQLVLDVPRDLPEIEGDRVRLEQVLTNLVENAIKFTPAGGHIRVSGEQVGDSLRLTVIDTGIGVPPEEQERIFDRFYQVDGSERRAYRGTGLGLSICEHIVERHRGRIWVESDGVPGHGSRFQVDLPIEFPLPEAPTIDFTTPATN